MAPFARPPPLLFLSFSAFLSVALNWRGDGVAYYERIIYIICASHCERDMLWGFPLRAEKGGEGMRKEVTDCFACEHYEQTNSRQTVWRTRWMLMDARWRGRRVRESRTGRKRGENYVLFATLQDANKKVVVVVVTTHSSKRLRDFKQIHQSKE